MKFKAPAGRPFRDACLRSLWLIASWSVHAAAEQPAPPPVESLETIVVKSEKLAVETLIDRKVYSVTDDAQSTFGTLSDILTVIPSVDVDPTGIVSLRGDTKVLILIDGKPSTQFAGPAAGDNLQSIPAGDIERIEILTTPPAQFKADGAAGVINIIKRRHHQDGSSGSLQASRGNGGRYVLGADESFNAGPLAASIVAGYRQDYRDRQVRSTVVSPDPSTGQPTVSRTAIDEKVRRATPTVKISAEYMLNDRQSVSGSSSWSNRGGLRTYTQRNSSGPADGLITASSGRLSSGHDPDASYDEKLGFAQKLGHAGESLDFSLHRSSSHQHEHYDYINDSLLPPAAVYLNTLSFQENNETTEAGADYALPLSKTSSLKLGYAFEQDDYRFENIAANVDPASGVPVIDPAQTNDFKFGQQINAIYASYQSNSDHWSWLGGLRAEEVHTDAQQLTDRISTTTRYFQLYPSLHIDRTVSVHSTLSFGASRRVTRPDPDNLNPYVDREYTPNLNAGNAHLKPQYTRSYEVGYGYEGKGRSYGATGYYRLNADSVTDVTEYLANGVSLTTKTNLPKDKSTGLEFSATGRIAGKLTYSVSGNLFYSQIDATALGIAGLQSTTGINAKAKLDWRPTDANSAQITLTRTDKRLTPQGYVGAIDIVNLGYKYRLKSELTAVATVTDLFNGQKIHRYSASPSFTRDYERQVFGRIYYLGLAYSFGSTKKDKQPTFEYDSAVGR